MEIFQLSITTDETSCRKLTPRPGLGPVRSASPRTLDQGFLKTLEKDLKKDLDQVLGPDLDQNLD